jgi:hypothetical protein
MPFLRGKYFQIPGTAPSIEGGKAVSLAYYWPETGAGIKGLEASCTHPSDCSSKIFKLFYCEKNDGKNQGKINE